MLLSRWLPFVPFGQRAGVAHNDLLAHNLVLPASKPASASLPWVCSASARGRGHEWTLMDMGYSEIVVKAKAPVHDENDGENDDDGEGGGVAVGAQATTCTAWGLPAPWRDGGFPSHLCVAGGVDGRPPDVRRPH